MLHGSERIIKHKLGLLNLAEELGNVSQACRIMGLSRDTFYRYKGAMDNGGVEALFDENRRQPNLKNRVDENTEISVVNYATDFPVSWTSQGKQRTEKAGCLIVKEERIQGKSLYSDIPAHAQMMLDLPCVDISEFSPVLSE